MDDKSGKPDNWLTRDALLLSLSAFFADTGYQAVAAVYPVLLVVYLRRPAYFYGLLLSGSYGIGSLFSLLGGKMGSSFSKKKLSIVGNALIPLMSLGVLFNSPIIMGLMFVFGWWARYFRTPTRRAWLVEVTDPAHRSKVFGFLHALDVGGGMIAVAYSITLIILGFGLRSVVLVTIAPLIVSTLLLFFAGSTPNKRFEALSKVVDNDGAKPADRRLYKAVLLAATLFGFSYYSFGFPVVTATESGHSPVFGILAFGLYLGVSSLAGYVFGSMQTKRMLTVLWAGGYIVASLSSLVIGTSYLFGLGLPLYYVGAAGLGLATGSVETFEPVVVSDLVSTKKLSSGLGWLSSTRAAGLFVSNMAMGVLFTLDQSSSYFYASASSFAAAMVLFLASKAYTAKKFHSFSGGNA
jgi:MFS family permease